MFDINKIEAAAAKELADDLATATKSKSKASRKPSVSRSSKHRSSQSQHNRRNQ